MNFFVKFLLLLQTEMTTPEPYGWFHWLWIGLTVGTIVLLFLLRKQWGERQMKWVLLIYGIIAAVMELLKQVSWSFGWDEALQAGFWDYQWYAAPFQLCSTPIYIAILGACLKKGTLRESCLSYLAFITIIGGLMTILIPDSCFCRDILVNIHTMWLHCGSFVVAVYLLMSGAVKLERSSLIRAITVFLVMAGIALAMNFGVYHSGLLGDETFNMFYISPYFISVLPVFDAIQQAVPYPVFLGLYLIALSLGGLVIMLVSKAFAYGVKKYKQRAAMPANK